MRFMEGRGWQKPIWLNSETFRLAADVIDRGPHERPSLGSSINLVMVSFQGQNFGNDEIDSFENCRTQNSGKVQGWIGP